MADGPPEVAPLLALVGGAPPSAAPVAAPAAPAPRAAPPRASESRPGGRRGPLSGQELGDFAVGDLVGSGGMGEVYRARQRSVDRLVALKVMPRSALDDPVRRHRFANEARAAALLDSPQVVRVHATGTHEGWLAIAMELVEGGTLAEAIARRRAAGGRFAPLEAAELAWQAARGLAAVHAQALVHRDIKPGNLLLGDDGALKLGDFGLVKFLDEEALTVTGSTLGTPLYMAPEQGRGLPPGPASDIYSLGCVLYELLTLRPPFTGDTAEALVFRHNYAEPELPRLIDPEVPADLQAVCLKCLQKDPAARYPSAAELAGDLERVRAGLAPLSALFPDGRLGTGAAEALRRLAGWRRRLPAALALLAATAAALAAGWWWWDARKTEEAQVRARLAPLAQAQRPPATAEADLARLQRLAGGDDPQVRQGRERLARLAAIEAALAERAGRLDQPAVRAEAESLVAELRAGTGADDPRLAAWQGRLAAVAGELAALRAALAEAERADPLTAALRRQAEPRLDRLAVLAGPEDGQLLRLRARCRQAADEEASLRARCARLDDPAPLSAAACDDLAQGLARLAALAPGDPPPASWPARLADERRRLDDLRRRLAAALAAPLDDDEATARAAPLAHDLEALLALDPADRRSLEQRLAARGAREAERAARLQALGERLAALDAPRSLPPGIEQDLARYEAMAGLGDARARAWRTRLAEVRLLQQRLEPLARPATPPAGAARDLDALAALVGADDPQVAAGRARLAAIAARQDALAAVLDRPAAIPEGTADALTAYAALVGGDDPALRRWRAKLTAWQAARGALEPLAGAWVLDPPGLAAAETALAAATGLVGGGEPALRAWAQRIEELRGPPAPAWAAGRGHDQHGPWLLLRCGAQEQRLRWMPPGTFQLGSPPGEDGRGDDETPVRVRLGRGLWVADGECLLGLWQEVMGTAPARSRDPRRPVEQVTRAEAEEFCQRLAARLAEARVRLPSEAEWECAARGGDPGPWAGIAPGQVATAIAHAGLGLDDPEPAGGRAPNPLGLRDCLGNVWEWCAGGYGPPPAGALVTDPAPPAGARAVARGGSWGDPLRRCRAAQRLALDPGVRSPYLGFRFVVEP